MADTNADAGLISSTGTANKLRMGDTPGTSSGTGSANSLTWVTGKRATGATATGAGAGYAPHQIILQPAIPTSGTGSSYRVALGVKPGSASGFVEISILDRPRVQSNWWNPYYPIRRNLAVDADTDLVANHPVYFMLKYDELVDLNKVREDLEDLEVIYADFTYNPPALYRISRDVEYDIDTGKITIIFNTLFPITTADVGYYVYMGNYDLIDPGIRPDYVSSLYVTTATPQNGGLMFSRITEDWIDGESRIVNARSAISFTGLNARLTVEKGPDRGIIELKLDNNAPTYVDTYNFSRQESVIYEANKLEAKQHYVRMRVTGNKSPNSTDYSIKLTKVEYSLYVEAVDQGEEIFSRTGPKTYMAGV